MEQIEKIEMVRGMFPDVNWFDIYRDAILVGRNGKFTPYHGKMAMVGITPDGSENIYTEDGNDSWIIGDASEEYYETVPYEVITYETLKTLDSVDASFGTPKIKPVIFGPLGGKFSLDVEWPGSKRKVGGREVSIAVSVLSSLDRSTKFRLKYGGLELVCTNGMVAFRVLSDIAQRHMQGSLDIEAEMKGLHDGLKKFDIQFETWEKMNKTELKVEARKSEEISEFHQVFDPLPLGVRQKEELLALPQIGGGNVTLEGMMKTGHVNMWSFHSLATQYVTHELTGGIENRMKKEDVIAKTFDDFLYRRAA